MSRFFSLLVFSFLLTLNSPAQFYGAFSPQISWKQINTEAVRVIFPAGLETQAQRTSFLINYMNENNRTTIGPKFKKLNLILNNQGIIPNGYVGLAPFRSEFYTTPYQKSESLGSLPWLDLLAIHEYRHALQFSNFNRGISKAGYLLFGEVFLAVAMNLTTPDWYFEGDAVMTETALTTQGRGRIPWFTKDYRSLLASETTYSYQKARNGSFKDYVPDHYTLGYLLCTYGRHEYGDDLWMNVINRTARFHGVIYPFSKALKHYSEKRTRRFYREAMDYYHNHWDSLNTIRNPELVIPFSPISKRTVTDYQYPLWDPSTQSWLAVKNTFSETHAIYKLDSTGTEELIVRMGLNLDAVFSASQNYLAWAEMSSDIRFSSRTYSDIVLFQRDSGKKIYLTQNSRYFSPSLSPDGTKIVAVRTDELGITRLVVIPIDNPSELLIVENPRNLYYSYPQWSTDGSQLYSSVRLPDGKMTIASIDPKNGDSHFLIPPFNHIIGKVTATDDEIYFTATFGGIENIFSLDPETDLPVQITESYFGAGHPAVNQQKGLLCYTDYHHSGRRLVIKDLKTSLNKRADFTSLEKLTESETAYAQVEGGHILNLQSDQDYSVEQYHPDLHAFNFHSWAPEFNTTSVGLRLISDNIFNNIHFEGAYSYYLNEQSGGYDISAVYGRFLPIMSLSYGQGYRDPVIGEDDPEKVWEQNFAGKVEVPLNFSRGLYTRELSGSLELRNTKVPGSGESAPPLVEKSIFNSVAFHGDLVIKKLQAYQNLATPLGIRADVLVQQSVSGMKAAQMQLILDASVRGILPNHNLVAGFSYKNESTLNPYQYIDLNRYPRGYQIPENDWISNAQINYHFPLFYPDIGFAGIVYLKRIRANIFFDLGMGYTLDPSLNRMDFRHFQSVGGELIFDTQILNLLPLSAGLRISALGTTDLYNKDRKTYFEVFIPVLRL